MLDPAHKSVNAPYSDAPTISVITSCFNAEKFLPRTIESVIRQTAVLQRQVKLQYIIQDAASKDGTAELVRSYDHPAIEFSSVRDNGFYEGLSRALPRATGDIVCYINAGDFFCDTAFSVVRSCFENREVHWLNGARVLVNEQDQIVSYRDPVPFRSRLIRAGVYGPLLPYIQQEATFWRRALHDVVDFDELAKYRLAGDYYLWTCFASIATLYSVRSYLGAFKIHHGQLSGDKKPYLNELKRSAVRRKGVCDWANIVRDAAFYGLSPKVRDAWDGASIIDFDHHSERWQINGGRG